MVRTRQIIARVGETGATTILMSIRSGGRKHLVVSWFQTRHLASRPSCKAPLFCYFSDTGTTVRLYVTSSSKWSKNLESDSPWKCRMCAPGLSGGRNA